MTCAAQGPGGDGSMRVLGLMSGTSVDGIDACAADLWLTPGTLSLRPLGLLHLPMPTDVRAAVHDVLPPATTTVGDLCRLDTALGRAFADAAVQARDRLCGGHADLAASPGQTVFHWVVGDQARGTLQLGQPAWIAEATGLPVVSDFRVRDVAAGGQGAPLVSIVDVLLLAGRTGVPAALNLGGIANVTVLPRNAEPLAFDTGPANALIDAAVRHYTDGAQTYDHDGAMAARGRVLDDLLDRLLDEPYYRQPPPKSTGKELFHRDYLLDRVRGLPDPSADDVVATVTRLTARTVAAALRRYAVSEVFVSGGGVHNPTLMSMLQCELGTTEVRASDALGLPTQAKEAYAFAVLGVLTVNGLSGTVPSCTGARHASVLGTITPGATPLRLPPPATHAPTRLRIVGSDA